MSLWAGDPQEEAEGWRLSPPPVVTAVLMSGVDCWGKAWPISSVASLTAQASPVFAGMSGSFSSLTYLFTSLPLPCLHIPPSHFSHSPSHSLVHPHIHLPICSLICPRIHGPTVNPSHCHPCTHLSAHPLINSANVFCGYKPSTHTSSSCNLWPPPIPPILPP